MGELLSKSKLVTRSMKFARPSRSLSVPGLDLTPPSRDVADRMVTMYLEAFESTCRIIHIPSFRDEYRKFWEHQEATPIEQRLRILLVIGIGSSLILERDIVPRVAVQQWTYASQTWLSGPLEKDRLSTSGIQIYCLTILARQIFSIGGDLVWMSMGSLIHRAMQIGLHRDPKHLPPMSSLQAEVRRRLWATVLEMAVQASLDAAMPPRISFDEFDTEPPSNVNDEDINESAIVVQPQPRSSYTESSMQLILYESLPIRLGILQLLNGLRSEISYLDVLSLSSRMNDAMAEHGRFLNENGIAPFHRHLIDYLFRRFMIPLHCIFACKACTNPLFHHSLKVCVDTAMALLSTDDDERFSRLIAIGGGLFREGLRFASSVMALELLAETETQQMQGMLYRNTGYRELLKRTIQDFNSLCMERIRHSENNVKMHMFLNMCLAQVEAMERGTPVEYNMARGGRDSLELSYTLLRERAGSTLPSPSNMDSASSGLNGALSEPELDWDLGFFMPSAIFS